MSERHLFVQRSFPCLVPGESRRAIPQCWHGSRKGFLLVCPGPAAATRRTASATRTPRGSGPTSAVLRSAALIQIAPLLLFVPLQTRAEPPDEPATCLGFVSWTQALPTRRRHSC